MDAESPAGNRVELIKFLNVEMESLAGILKVYARRAGLAGDEDAASELLNSVVVEALAHAGRFDPARPPRAWLLGIAANLVRRRQAEAARLNRREPLANDLLEGKPEILDEDELFERLARGAQAISGTAVSAAPLAGSAPWGGGPAVSDLRASQEDRDGLAAALALLPLTDREVLRLFASGDLDGDFMTAALHVTPGAARVRLHRAITRLRRVWKLTQEETTHD